nr:hypothetical protein [Rhodovulum robiginosum]
MRAPRKRKLAQSPAVLIDGAILAAQNARDPGFARDTGRLAAIYHDTVGR